MNLENLIGHTLDEKYKIEKELGRGGMGAVFLATHIGTERPVAVKVIVPEFMERTEFVERFRREARAAGRLRHPNVVDVTDFGFDDTSGGRVAYLVMEYLDGCTLGEVLEEEGKLPLTWTIDILEQVCSAVEEAHKQGIIHRDLKPDNIWLEPNQRGGYTVKVLDFGIAKLEESQINASLDNTASNFSYSDPKTQIIGQKDTIANENQAQTFHQTKKNSTVFLESQTIDQKSYEQTISNKETFIIEAEKNTKTSAAEAGTLIQTVNETDSESGTAILPANHKPKIESENAKTKLISAQIETDKSIEKILTTDNSALEKKSTSQLTHVGAILGTPLYMSPEQCRGERLTPQSDIYSLGVIAYRMLSGKTPFAGNYLNVMQAHKETAPPVLEAKKAPRKVKKVIETTMAKNPAERPPTAQAFATKLRAQSEGIGILMQRALVIYSEHLPKFLGLAILLYSPLIIFTILKAMVTSLYAGEAISRNTSSWLNGILTLGTTFVGIFCGHFIIGTTTWIVTQILAMPLRPVKLRLALQAAQKKWKTFAGTGLLSTILVFLGLLVCLIGFPILYVWFALVSSVVMMENLRGRAALKRSKTLVMRSLGTTVAAMSIMLLVPMIIAGLISFFAATTVKSFSDAKDKTTAVRREVRQSGEAENGGEKDEANKGIQVKMGNENVVTINEDVDEKPKLGGINGLIQKTATEILMLPFQIFITSLISIIIALLYIKTRLVGGESIQSLLGQFQETEQPQTNWQKRIRERLEHSGKLASKS
ncbi:MAG: protein kinase [Acidobacteria bacterium]|nr:protein kinase [Acidobacteriota bacterium]